MNRLVPVVTECQYLNLRQVFGVEVELFEVGEHHWQMGCEFVDLEVNVVCFGVEDSVPNSWLPYSWPQDAPSVISHSLASGLPGRTKDRRWILVIVEHGLSRDGS